MTPLCSLTGVSVVYRRPWSGEAPKRALTDINLTIHAGESVGLVGESGCGKTTLVRVACGLVRRESGDVCTLGVDPAHTGGPPARAQLLVQDAAAALNPGLRVREWLAESARVHRPGDRDAGARALAAYGLGHRADAYPDALSGGEKRRVALAALSLADPLIVFYDEPTAGLDAARTAELLELLQSRRGADRAVVMVTHDLLLARHLCTRVVFLHAGRVVEDVPSAELPSVTEPSARRLCIASGLLS